MHSTHDEWWRALRPDTTPKPAPMPVEVALRRPTSPLPDAPSMRPTMGLEWDRDADLQELADAYERDRLEREAVDQAWRDWGDWRCTMPDTPEVWFARLEGFRAAGELLREALKAEVRRELARDHAELAAAIREAVLEELGVAA